MFYLLNASDALIELSKNERRYLLRYRHAGRKAKQKRVCFTQSRKANWRVMIVTFSLPVLSDGFVCMEPWRSESLAVGWQGGDVVVWKEMF